MSAKTLSAIQTFSSAAPPSKRLTYSIAPVATTHATPECSVRPGELELFLENDNPLGCIRGVLWVIAFNAVVFLTVLSAWATFKYLW